MVIWVQASQQTAGAVVLLSCHGEFSGKERGAVVSSFLPRPQFVVFFTYNIKVICFRCSFPPPLGVLARENSVRAASASVTNAPVKRPIKQQRL